ncbi:hypothetical protein H696_06251 [Fonticula alba]|uniref:Uncharacterized protein n=1 Tax=Fonticula alba TaxID=691883 RepID=A0A058Z1C0_FONAL|nr:hypothetical protein H696_06251 [Fonticula alba]KCV67327.1 hypothetical protein H696_06251 [Fonticula alba]|eukprot:XP_009498271.1 hypothetical protein H696_06251 [Fonticula alba]
MPTHTPEARLTGEWLVRLGQVRLQAGRPAPGAPQLEQLAAEARRFCSEPGALRASCLPPGPDSRPAVALLSAAGGGWQPAVPDLAAPWRLGRALLGGGVAPEYSATGPAGGSACGRPTPELYPGQPVPGGTAPEPRGFPGHMLGLHSELANSIGQSAEGAACGACRAPITLPGLTLVPVELCQTFSAHGGGGGGGGGDGGDGSQADAPGPGHHCGCPSLDVDDGFEAALRAGRPHSTLGLVSLCRRYVRLAPGALLPGRTLVRLRPLAPGEAPPPPPPDADPGAADEALDHWDLVAARPAEAILPPADWGFATDSGSEDDPPEEDVLLDPAAHGRQEPGHDAWPAGDPAPGEDAQAPWQPGLFCRACGECLGRAAPRALAHFGPEAADRQADPAHWPEVAPGGWSLAFLSTCWGRPDCASAGPEPADHRAGGPAAAAVAAATPGLLRQLAESAAPARWPGPAARDDTLLAWCLDGYLRAGAQPEDHDPAVAQRLACWLSGVLYESRAGPPTASRLCLLVDLPLAFLAAGDAGQPGARPPSRAPVLAIQVIHHQTMLLAEEADTRAQRLFPGTQCALAPWGFGPR